MENELNDTLYENISWSSRWEDYYGNDSWAGERNYWCDVNTHFAIVYGRQIMESIGIVFAITTLLTITCNHRLRKKRFIFPFNIVLADCILDITSFIKDVEITMQVCLWLPCYPVIRLLQQPPC